MRLYENTLYEEDLDYILGLNIPWDRLRDKSVFISGATGLIGSFLIDSLLKKNSICDLNCNLYALSRDERKAKKRFSKWEDNRYLHLLSQDVNIPIISNSIKNIDYVFHLASNTHPLQYSTDPIGTITSNIVGTKNMLDFAIANNAERFVFASSCEVYGENRGDVELFTEEYCGYINSNTTRAGYPESKRCGEALCQAYKTQKNLDVVIPRFSRTYGPTMLMSDSRAIGQFIKKGIAKEEIILKSEGKQYYSYTYVADAVAGLLYILYFGLNGNAYNISDACSDILLKDLAVMIADIVGTQVVFQVPDSIEAAGYSKATKARLDGSKLRKMGWKAKYDIRTGMERTISILYSQTSA